MAFVCIHIETIFAVCVQSDAGHFSVDDLDKINNIIFFMDSSFTLPPFWNEHDQSSYNTHFFSSFLQKNPFSRLSCVFI